MQEKFIVDEEYACDGNDIVDRFWSCFGALMFFRTGLGFAWFLMEFL